CCVQTSDANNEETKHNNKSTDNNNEETEHNNKSTDDNSKETEHTDKKPDNIIDKNANNSSKDTERTDKDSGFKYNNVAVYKTKHIIDSTYNICTSATKYNNQITSQNK